MCIFEQGERQVIILIWKLRPSSTHLGRLSGHLDAGLQDGDGEGGMGGGAQPQPEIFVGLLDLKGGGGEGGEGGREGGRGGVVQYVCRGKRCCLFS